MKVKKGDNVVVIAGKDKGKKSKVLETSPKTGKIVVENVNVVTKHRKPRSAQDKGGIVKQTNPIPSSNVMVVCQACDKATRVAHKELNGKKVRACKKCGASLDKAFVKIVKKETKKTEQKIETKEVKTEAKEVKVESKEKSKVVSKPKTTTAQNKAVSKPRATTQAKIVSKNTKPVAKTVKQQKIGSKGQ